MAVKKFFDNANRLVIVCHANSECVGEFSEYVVDEAGWSTFKPVAPEPGLASLGTIARSCAQFVLWRKRKRSAFAVDVRQGTTVEELVGHVLHVYEVDMTELTKLMENMLMDEAVGTIVRKSTAPPRSVLSKQASMCGHDTKPAVGNGNNH